MTEETNSEAPRRAAPLTVGIGASAGGLEAFTRFFSAMPADSGMAFVLVQHLSPDHASMLAPLLDKVTAMEVIEATDGARVKPDRVFVIPPDATMTMDEGLLRIVRPAPPRNLRRPIDTFFHSLAEDQGENAICVILSGTGSDGAQGLTAVKERGGLTLAQAEYDHHAMSGMPRSAADTGLVDEILPVEAMPARILSHHRHMANVAGGKEDGVRRNAASHLSVILRALHAHTGYDFSDYKEKTLVRRLQRRMQVLQVETFEAYIAGLADHPEELDMLLREVLIGVTQFFRDPSAFQALNEMVLEKLAATRGANDEIRIWVPGCATGEEAYTIAILLREAMDARRPRPKVQIFATDLDERAIARARKGRYAIPIAGISAGRAERWFTVEGNESCVVPEIREMCIFSVHSVLKHPPFSRLDLVSCRNLLIYLDASAQERLMGAFHYSLKPNGHLFLGSSESVTRANKLFDVRDKTNRIFERRDAPAGSLRTFFDGSPKREHPTPDHVGSPADDAIEKSIRRVMNKHYPPHLLLDRANRIVRFSGGRVGQYLEPSAGAASLGLFDMLRKPLRPAARDLLREVRAGSDLARRNNLPIRIDGESRLISMIVERLTEQGPDSEFVVLAFQDAGPGLPHSKPDGEASPSDETLRLLQNELNTTKNQLHATIREMETNNEDLRSSNEEYQSINEELQSSNEELETAKEEMQSITEELHTINAEMTRRNESLSDLNSDLANLLESTEIATLFIDDGFRVRRFTRGVSELFHLRDADIGRPITEIVSLLDYGDLERDVRSVLRALTPMEKQVELHSSKATFILRIRPYRTVGDVIDGAVLTFIDITQSKLADDAIRSSEARFRMLFEHIDEGFCTLEKVDTHPDEPRDYRYLTANPGFTSQSGIEFPIGRTVREVAPGIDEDWFDIHDKVWQTGEPIRFEHAFGDDGRVLELFAFRMEDAGRPRLGVIFLDISVRSRHAQQQELLLQELDHRVRNLFAITSAVVSLSARSATSPQEMAANIHGRLGALAAAQKLVRPYHHMDSGVSRSATTLRAIVETVLRPHLAKARKRDEERVAITGPEVSVAGDAVTSFAMVLHELATNAAKYGALSAAGGRIGISWDIAGDRLSFTWSEQGGPKVVGPPDREGFGSQLARRSVDGQLNGDLAFAWDPEGLVVRLSAATERLA